VWEKADSLFRLLATVMLCVGLPGLLVGLVWIWGRDADIAIPRSAALTCTAARKGRKTGLDCERVACACGRDILRWQAQAGMANSGGIRVLH